MFAHQCLTFCHARGVLWFSVPNEGARSEATGYELKKMGMRPGVADMVVIVSGLVHFLEFKTPKGRTSEAQRAFREDCENLGLPYEIVRSPEQIVQQLLEWGALRCDPLTTGWFRRHGVEIQEAA